MQLILYFVYRDKKGVTKKQPPIDEESMEMSNGKTHQMKQSNANEIQG
jgi:solute carrier family 50 protein (sugar transporter)